MTKKKKAALAAAGAGMAAIIAAGTCLGVFLGNKQQTEAELKFGTPFLMTAEDGNGITLLSAVLEESEYAEYGIETAESVQLATATVYPEDATDKYLYWTAAWTDGESEWASGKDVEDYVVIYQTEEGGTEAAVACLQAFGEQVTVTVTLRFDPSIFASATCEYVQRTGLDEANLVFRIGNAEIALTDEGEIISAQNYSATFGLTTSEDERITGGTVTVDTDRAYTIAADLDVTVTLGAHDGFLYNLGSVSYYVDLPKVTLSAGDELYFTTEWYSAQGAVYRYTPRGGSTQTNPMANLSGDTLVGYWEETYTYEIAEYDDYGNLTGDVAEIGGAVYLRITTVTVEIDGIDATWEIVIGGEYV